MTSTPGSVKSSNERTDYMPRSMMEKGATYFVYVIGSNCTELMQWDGVRLVHDDGNTYYHYDECPRLGEAMPLEKYE